MGSGCHSQSVAATAGGTYSALKLSRCYWEFRGPREVKQCLCCRRSKLSCGWPISKFRNSSGASVNNTVSGNSPNVLSVRGHDGIDNTQAGRVATPASSFAIGTSVEGTGTFSRTVALGNTKWKLLGSTRSGRLSPWSWNALRHFATSWNAEQHTLGGNAIGI